MCGFVYRSSQTKVFLVMSKWAVKALSGNGESTNLEQDESETSCLYAIASKTHTGQTLRLSNPKRPKKATMTSAMIESKNLDQKAARPKGLVSQGTGW